MKKSTNFNYFCLSFCYLLTSILNEALAQTSSCSESDWRCKNGECIPTDEICDGAINCTDGSDETAANCLDVRCPGYSYQCAYGACISGNLKCNGVKDCADNSDESPALCGTTSMRVSPGNCSESFFPCESGECIPEEEACDGKKDCRDASDETVKLCSSMPCPSFAFKCGYGACVSGKAKCNGFNDCIDGSDESLESCGASHTTISPPEGRPVTPLTGDDDDIVTPTRGPPITQVTPPGQSSRDGCIVRVTANMIVSHEYDPTTPVRDGTQSNNLQSILYKCRKNHFLFGPNRNTCLNGVWLLPYPECTKTCSATVLQGVTFTVECEYKKQGIDCSGPIRPGTRAKVSCAIGYQKPDRPQIFDILVCEPSGDWDYYPTSCVPECGRETVVATPFVSDGEITNITSVPWHTAIYRWTNDKVKYICGGSIISAKLVLTAAHCFKETREPNRYTIFVGKVLSNFYATETLETQSFNVSEIHIPPTYLGEDAFFHNDIAVLVLNKFIRYRPHIKPICIEWYSFTQASIDPGTIGKVVGWGRLENDGPISEDLRSVELSVISKENCLKKVSQLYHAFINAEKFCVGSEEGEGAACQGDSGGGFVVSKTIGGIPTFFLWGVLSTSLSRDNCGHDYYVTFTNIQFHKEMITEYDTKYRPKVVRNTRNPVYDEDFTFYGLNLQELGTMSLHFVVLSFDRYSRDDVIGEVVCPLSGVDLSQIETQQIALSKEIQPRSLKIRAQGRGELLISLCWQPAAARLTVVLLKARNLPRMDVTGLADPYVKLYLLYNGQRIAKKKTHVKKRTLSPVFNESFAFDIPTTEGNGASLDGVSLELMLLDWDRVTKNEVIGRLELGGPRCVGSALNHWQEVHNSPRRQIAEWHKLHE